MKTLFFLLAAVFAIVGCASYSQIMIDAQGRMYRCGAYGHGLIGIAQADQIQGDCLASMKAAGYIESEKACVVGVIFSESSPADTLLSILKVAPNSPAAISGIRGGDILLSVDSQRVRKVMDAKILIFGMAGTSVHLVVQRNNGTIPFDLVRASYTKVYGMP